jgi:hypothetical protein
MKKSEAKLSETKNCCKRNKAKIWCINFALVGSENFEVKKSEKKKKNILFSCERGKRMQNRSRFA